VLYKAMIKKGKMKKGRKKERGGRRNNDICKE
jgi:hypothetical protein